MHGNFGVPNITGANSVFLVFFKWCMASFKAKASGAFGVK